MTSAEPRGLYADRLTRLMNRDAKRAYRLPRGPQPILLGARRDQDLGQVDDADQPRGVLLVPAAEELARPGVVEVGAVERADQNVGVAYSTYMEGPRLSRLISRVVWGGDSKPYYDNMSAVADGGTTVDCPCGAGPALRALRPDAEVRYVAVDLSPSMLRRARKRAVSRGLGSVEFIEADAADLPLPVDSADLFLSFWGLHCFDDPPAALAESARVLKPGGRLVGSCFVRGNDSLRQRLLVRADTLLRRPALPLAILLKDAADEI